MRIVSALLVLLVGGGLLTGLFLLRFNHFHKFEGAPLAGCTPVVGLPGVEDAVADPRLELAWLSSLDRLDERGDVRGAIMAFDPDNPLDTASWRDRTNGVPEQFKPLGLDVYQDGDIHRLFVVNTEAPSVLVYTVTGSGELALIDTLSDKRLTSPNAIVATGPKSFYVTNAASGSSGGWQAVFEFLTVQASGSVLYYDGNSWSQAAGSLHFANGIEIGDNGRRLYVAETAAKRVRVFQRDPSLGYLQPEKRIALGSFPDNLTWSEDGRLIATAIPRPLSLPGYLAGRRDALAAQIFAIDPATDEADLVYQNDGSQLSTLSVGAQIGQKLLLGAFAANKILLCDGSVPQEYR